MAVNMDVEVRETLESAYVYIHKLANGLEEIIKTFRSSGAMISKPEAIVKAQSDLIDGLDGVIWLLNVIRLTTEIHGIKIELDQFEDQFRDITDAIENTDYRLIADVIAYDFIPALSEWFDVLDIALFDNDDK